MICRCAAIVLSLYPLVTTAQSSPVASNTERASDRSFDGYRRSSQYLTMRDGARLAVDILRPTRNGELHSDPLPVVWTHHRYNRAFFRRDTLIDYASGFGRGIDRLLQHGYVVAAVDTRGGGASFGTQQGFFMPDEARDAYEVTEWLAAQPWSTGKVGMTGRSYLGITQLFAASQAPPHLKAIFPEMYVFEWYPMIYPGGVFRDDFFSKWQLLTHNLDNAVTFSWGPQRFEGVASVDGDNGRRLRDSAIAGHRANRDMVQMWVGVPYRNSVDPTTGQQIHLERGPANISRPDQHIGCGDLWLGRLVRRVPSRCIAVVRQSDGSAEIGGGPVVPWPDRRLRPRWRTAALVRLLAQGHRQRNHS